MNKLLAAAYKYISSGICVIATRSKTKDAFLYWTDFQERMITKEEVEKQFNDPRAESLAIVTGNSSGNLEVIDIDTKYDITGTLYERYIDAIKENMPGLFDRLLIIKTQSGGYHFYYRCEVIEGNQKLAKRASTNEELEIKPKDEYKVLIETRGHKGYVLAPPSPGYIAFQNKDIPTISVDEREVLLTLARSFHELIEPPAKLHKSTTYNPKEFGLSPFDDYNRRGDITALLEKHGWTMIKDTNLKTVYRRPGKDEGTSGNFNKEKNWFSVFSTSTVFEAQKAYRPYAVYAILEHKGDFSAAAKQLLQEGYGAKRIFYGDKVERDLFKKKQDGLSNEQLAAYLSKELKKNATESADIVEKMNAVWGETICTFWDISHSGKISINRTRLINFLHSVGGFSLYYYDKSSTIFRVVKCKDGFVEEVSSEHMKKFLKGYVDNLPDTFDGGVTSDDLMEIILTGATNFFSDGVLEFLNRSDFDFLKDTAKEAFLPFRNGVVAVTSQEVCLLNYSEIKKVIWKSQVIDADIHVENIVTSTDFSSFVNLISGDSQERYDYATTLIGYLLHKFKDMSKTYAVILAEENDDESKGGGTGKGLFVTAISKLINTQRVDGKNFKIDKTFAFQRVDLDTKLVVIEDTRKNVDFEGFYTMVTEGITVEKKNKDELFIHYKDSPKFIFTTNYTISGVADHAKRRQMIFEFANYFNAANTPVMHFKHLFFEDWDKDEWNRFYNYMFNCIQKYLSRGILKIDLTDKIKKKNIKLKYGEEFQFWWEGYAENGCEEWKSASDLYSEFLIANNLERRDYSQTKFGRGMQEAAQSVSWVIVKERLVDKVDAQNGSSKKKVMVRVEKDILKVC